MSSSPPTHADILLRAIHALGGSWDANRALSTLRDAGVAAPDRESGEKQARKALRDLARGSHIVKINDRPVEYRPAPR
ncbi:hypothetical protein [Streptomyces sp. NBC_01353]|uniref:hypothetical protein n=1 Tax=Streptomyces sp. NBC_01353 TaxID=2903835 RepID=UPI002E360FCF|nr:hypothetical protein [Streptomyces sp. NBC_01353]